MRDRKNTPYDNRFYDNMTSGAIGSAQIIVPLLVNLVSPKSVVDIGCGRGAWLSAFTEADVEDVLGVDGDYVDRSSLLIEPAKFLPADVTRPLDLHRRFDLALCLEVAEHLPASAAATLVRSLTALAPVIVFSAAPPGQGGTSHVNEQWPIYWKQHFAEHDFMQLDPIRRHVCQHADVAWWYQQNMFVYAHQEAIDNNKTLQDELGRSQSPRVEFVSGNILREYMTFRGLLRQLGLAGCRAIKNRLVRNRKGR